MQSKEMLLGALVGTELQRMKGKLDFYGIPADIPVGENWVAPDALTLERFMEANPRPETPDQTTLYGIAWEFIWGKKPPQEVIDAKESLKVRARTGMQISEMENLWLKIMTADTDMF